MTEDALVKIVQQEGVTDFIKTNKAALLDMFCALLHAFSKIHPNQKITLKIVGPLIWDIMKWATCVRNVFVLHGFDMNELDKYGGPVSVAIVEQVIEVLEVDFESVTIKKP